MPLKKYYFSVIASGAKQSDPKGHCELWRSQSVAISYIRDCFVG